MKGKIINIQKRAAKIRLERSDKELADDNFTYDNPNQVDKLIKKS